MCNNSVYHGFSMTTSSLYPTHTNICKVPQLSSELQTQIQHHRPGRFSNALQRREPIDRWVKIQKAGIEFLFEHGEVINYFGLCINSPSHYKDAGVLPNSVAREEENCSGISP